MANFRGCPKNPDNLKRNKRNNVRTIKNYKDKQPNTFTEASTVKENISYAEMAANNIINKNNETQAHSAEPIDQTPVNINTQNLVPAPAPLAPNCHQQLDLLIDKLTQINNLLISIKQNCIALNKPTYPL